MQNRLALLLLFALLAGCGQARDLYPPTSTPAEAAAPRSTVEEAHARLQAEGSNVQLVLVSAASPGEEGTIYWDLTERHIRATTGPDEGIDTRGASCYPDCIFVREQDVNDLNVVTWLQVLRHEARHVTQARNNPDMAHAFRGADGRFTPYAAFLEACADYGINVKASYHAQERIDALKSALGPDLEGVLAQACDGQTWAYDTVRAAYEAHGNRFNSLFPPYD